MLKVLDFIPYTKNVLLVLSDKDDVVERSARNIPNVKTLTVNYLNVYDMLKYTTLVLLKESVEKLNNLR
jgi:large subunit ribosomal protein L4